MSFFDDEPDQPTRVTRPARPRRSAGAAHAAHGPDPEVARRRQLMLFAGLAVVAILLIFAFKSCSSTRHKNSLKDYTREVSSIAQSSDRQVSKQLFDVLTGGGQVQDVQVAVNQVRLVADEDAKRAKALSVPGDMAPAQRNLELTLALRAQGVRRIGDLLPKAMSNQPGAFDSIRRVAGQMQAFLASDVVYSQRVEPLVAQALASNGIGDQALPRSRFLPNIGWLDATQVRDRLNPQAAGGTASNGQPKPGTHGHGLISVTAGGVVLQPGAAVNRVPATPGLAFDVTLANQGQNDETNVAVAVKVQGSGRPISVKKRLNQTKAAANATVTIPLGATPPKGATKVTISVQPVPGEKKTDNNTQTYTVFFT